MDDKRFDTMIKGLTKTTSRRQVFGGLLGGAAATLAGVGVLEAKKGGNGKAKGPKNGEGPKNGKGKKGKTTFCHRTGNGYHAITVSQSARKAHLGHGDVECTPHPCRTYTGSCTDTPVKGVCDFTPTNEGVECAPGKKCDNKGDCI